MQFSIEINCDNDAFAESPGAEIAMILRTAAKRLENGQTSGKLFDANGNKVGTFQLGDSK
jgi:hypothetical protein